MFLKRTIDINFTEMKISPAKKILLVIELVAIMTLLVACGGSTANDDSDAGDNAKVTKEWIMGQYDIAEEELSGLDVEMIADHEDWKQRNVLKFYRNKEEMLHGLNAVSEQMSLEKNDKVEESFAYLWESSACEDTLPDKEKIVRVALYKHYTDETASIMMTALFDAVNETICYSNINDVTYDAGLADETILLTKEEVDEFKNTVDYSTLNYGLENHADSNNWQIALEYDGGIVYSYNLNDLSQDESASKMVKAFFEKMTIEYDGFMLKF